MNQHEIFEIKSLCEKTQKLDKIGRSMPLRSNAHPEMNMVIMTILNHAWCCMDVA